jgi:hypothetical protein
MVSVPPCPQLVDQPCWAVRLLDRLAVGEELTGA